MKPASTIRVDQEVRVPLRDGLALVADVYRPAGGGRYPVLLMRNAYDRRVAQIYLYAHPRWYAERGYAVVVQDIRGRWGSPGEFDPLVHEATDGADTVTWAAEQPWSNGRVGMYGFSYLGISQLLTAAEQPDALRAIAPALAPSHMREGWLYNGGAFALSFALGWAIELGVDLARRRSPDLEVKMLAAAADPHRHFDFRPLRDVPLLRSNDICGFYFDWMEREADPGYWSERQVESRYERITIPALHIGGWYDVFIDGTIKNYAGARRGDDGPTKSTQRLIVGPWHHIPTLTPAGPLDFGPETLRDLDVEHLRWFDLWLHDHDEGGSDRPAVTAFMTGANQWFELDQWPPADSRSTRYFLRSGGRANSAGGDGSLTLEEPDGAPADVFVYDPARPVPSVGGQSCCWPDTAPMGPADQRAVEVLHDVLIYTSPPLGTPVVAAGPITAEIFAVTDALDTDWVVRVCDVDPEGRSVNLQEGIVRARFRRSADEPVAVVPGEAYPYQIDVGSVFHQFKRGHRIRIQVSSSSFPTWEPNPNTGHQLGTDRISDRVVATQQVLHSPGAASSISIPVLEGGP